MKTSQIITIDYLRSRGICGLEDTPLVQIPKEGLTPLEFLQWNNIRARNRLEILLHEDFLPKSVLLLLTCDWAAYACEKVDWNDSRSLQMIEVARRYANGKATYDDLWRAWHAALTAQIEAQTNIVNRDEISQAIEVAVQDFLKMQLDTVWKALLNKFLRKRKARRIYLTTLPC